jgi:D-alanine-D-alanine ligase
MKLKIGLTYDLRTEYLAEGFSEDDVAEFDSESTIASIEEALHALGHWTDRIGHARRLCERLVAGDRWDLVFNIAEGLQGRCRESQVPCILDLYQIGYTFSDGLVLAATLDKGVAKRLVAAAGLATPAFAVVETPEDASRVALKYPVFAKPLTEGTGAGIDARSRVDCPEALATICEALLKRFEQPVLVEEYLPGREVTTGILGNGRSARVLGTMEVRMRRDQDNAIYSYQTKEYCESLVDYCPMEPGALRREVEELALAAYRVLECRDAARVDIRMDADGRPSFLEVNPLAGLHPSHSDLCMIATQEGMNYTDLIGAIVNGAIERLGLSDDH